ncbi:DUF4349 domain-containing protein [Microbacterium gorillae]|uniref:DUF4349 domain-containing protein n=1 Tax=Microbacterium gorillae TaxID=1231063 RepID=UPI000694C179|nr:DUF4349 domain-containing protein [Microbacterium gorillae]
MTAKSRTIAWATTLLAAALLLAGCSAAGGAGGSAAQPQHVAEAQGSADGTAQSAADGTAESPGDAVVITGEIWLSGKDPIAIAERATKLVGDAGGRIDGRDEYADDGHGTGRAALVARIPAKKLDAVRAELAKIASIDQTSLHSAAVGGTQRDLEARAGTLRASLARYTAWLQAATKPADLVSLEESLSDRQTKLEEIEAQLRELKDQVSMSTITLTISTTPAAPEEDKPDTVLTALAMGWNGFAAFWNAVLLGLSVALPWLILLALLAVVALWFMRRYRRRTPAVAGVPAAGMRPTVAPVVPAPTAAPTTTPTPTPTPTPAAAPAAAPRVTPPPSQSPTAAPGSAPRSAPPAPDAPRGETRPPG